MRKRLLKFLILAAATAGAIYWFADDATELFSTVSSYVDNRELPTLESHFTAQEIMERNRKALLNGAGKSFQEAELQFQPYLLLDVKYMDASQRTKQSAILWSLVEGEMVLNTDSWEMTSGFQDAIDAKTSPQEFKLLNALAENRGALTREKLQKELSIDQEALSYLIDSAKEKQLIVAKGNDLLLHFENPHFRVTPQTKITTPLVMKASGDGKKLGRRYSKANIEKIAKAAFGPDFTIRKTEEIYLPVYQIAVLNPDGSVHSTSWNALTGQQIHSLKSVR